MLPATISGIRALRLSLDDLAILPFPLTLRHFLPLTVPNIGGLAAPASK